MDSDINIESAIRWITLHIHTHYVQSRLNRDSLKLTLPEPRFIVLLGTHHSEEEEGEESGNQDHQKGDYTLTGAVEEGAFQI